RRFSAGVLTAVAFAGSGTGFLAGFLRDRARKGRVLNMVWASCRSFRDSHQVNAAKMMANAEIVNGIQSDPSATTSRMVDASLNSFSEGSWPKLQFHRPLSPIARPSDSFFFN